MDAMEDALNASTQLIVNDTVMDESPPPQHTATEPAPPPVEGAADPFVFQFNDEEIWVEDPTPEKIQRVRDELATYDRLIRKFTDGVAQWSLENIGTRLMQLTHDLYALDESTGAPLAAGYIAGRILPHVGAALINVADKYLPKAHRLDTTEVDQLVFDMGRLLNGERFQTGLLRVTNYADLLHPTTAAQLKDRTLPQHAQDWLQEQAEKKIPELKKQLDGPLTQRQKWELHAELTHLTEILCGRYGGGYNTAEEEHWELVEWDFLLNGVVGDIRASKLLSPKAAVYITALAKDLLTDFEENIRETEGKALDEPTYRTHYEHIKKFVQTGELPYGYRVVQEQTSNNRA